MFLVVAFFYHLFLSTSSAVRTTSKTCPPFPHAVLENGKISALGNQKLSFRCDPGYFLTAPAIVRCFRGKWSSERTPRCIKKGGMCDDPPPVADADVMGEERSVGSVVQYMCKPGFVLLGEARRRCLQSEHWSGISPECLDESEPLQNVAERLKNSFVTELGQHSTNDSVPEGRLLDPESIHHGLELVILFDRSSSIDPEDFKIGIEFVQYLLKEFGVKNGNMNTIGTRAAVLAFGTKVDLLFNLDNETIGGPLAADNALNTLKPGGGGTAMELALTNVFTQLSPMREKAKKAIFLMTDGEPNIGTPGITPEDVANQLKDHGGFEIFTMGIGRGINRDLLSSVASHPLLSHVFILEQYPDLKKIMKEIKDAPPKKKTISPEKCGYIKGESFYLKKWPWLAAIYTSYNGSLSFCSGTLICSQWVLSAASCFHRNAPEEQKKQNVFVVLGENNLVQTDNHQMNFYAIKVALHPNFNPQNIFQHNLALLKLNLPVPLKKFRPICLPPTDRTVPLHMELNINGSIAGWGLPTPNIDVINGATIQFSRTTALVELAEPQECRRKTRSFAENTFCAGLGKQTCTGDIGSPVVALDPSSHLHHILGVMNGKEKCEGGVNQYLELTSYIQWIHRVTKKCHIQHWMA